MQDTQFRLEYCLADGSDDWKDGEMAIFGLATAVHIFHQETREKTGNVFRIVTMNGATVYDIMGFQSENIPRETE